MPPSPEPRPPDFVAPGVRLYCGDCLEILPELEGIDAIVSDPPYGIKACDRSDGGVGSISSGSKFYGRQEWDHAKADRQAIDWMLGKGCPVVMWGGNYYEMPAASCWLVWDKMQRDFTFADAELAWTNLERAVRIFSYSRGQLVQEGKVHPTQKPVGLMEWCIEQARVPSKGVVLDPYMGSASTGVACLRKGRSFVGIEKSRDYFDLAVRRIKAELNRHPLFEPPVA